MLVENSSDELRVGAKDQSNSVIARSLRNSFRASLARSLKGQNRRGGRDLDELGAFPGYRIQPNFECRKRVARESDGGG